MVRTLLGFCPQVQRPVAETLLGDTEVAEYQLAVAEEDVSWRDVAVSYALAMQKVQQLEDLGRLVSDGVRRHRALAGLEEVPDGAVVHPLEDEHVSRHAGGARSAHELEGVE